MRKKVLLMLGSAIVAASVTISNPAESTQAAEAKGAMQSSNVLGIPLKRGKVQLSCPFLKVDATIIRADKEKVIFASNYKNVSIEPNKHRPGGVSLDYGDDKLNGSIEKGANQAVLSIDNIGKFTISMTDSKHFVISGGLPFNINVTFVD